MNNIINHNGNLYLVKRQIQHQHFNKKDGTFVPDAIRLWKEHLNVDIALKNSTHYLFCNEITDLDWEMVTSTKQN